MRVSEIVQAVFYFLMEVEAVLSRHIYVQAWGTRGNSSHGCPLNNALCSLEHLGPSAWCYPILSPHFYPRMMYFLSFVIHYFICLSLSSFEKAFFCCCLLNLIRKMKTISPLIRWWLISSYCVLVVTCELWHKLSIG